MRRSFFKSTTVWAIAVVVAVILFISTFLALNGRADAQSQGGGRLLTIHDRGQEKVLLSNAGTIGEALSDAGISVDGRDAVEPAVDQKLVAPEYSINIYRARPVTVIDGPTRQKIVTPYQTAEQITKDVGITLYPEDTTAIRRSNDLLAGGAGLELVIDRATLFSLNLFGTVTQIRTQGATVGEMLKEKGITLTENDRASLPLNAPIAVGTEVKVWREGKQTVTAEEAVAFEVEQIRDADQAIGYKRVQTEGKAGSRNVTYEIEIKNGEVVSRVEIASIVTIPASKQVEVIGAKSRGVYTSPSENESITWSYLIAQGFTREQTAGIMGNLKQEHGFNTGGDGLAQWTGSRKAKLMSRADPYSIHTQLDFMMEELSGSYSKVQNLIRASATVEQSVQAFQNGYERCGLCMEDRRVQFAYNILASH